MKPSNLMQYDAEDNIYFEIGYKSIYELGTGNALGAFNLMIMTKNIQRYLRIILPNEIFLKMFV